MEQYAHATQEADEESDEPEEITQVVDSPLYVVLQIQKKNKCIILGEPDSLCTYQYTYSKATQILDTQGEYISLRKIAPGSLVLIEQSDVDASLTTLQLAPQSWYQDNITRFTVDDSIGMLVIGDTKYRYDEYLRVFSGKQEIDITQLAEGDIIRVQGVDKQIFSIQLLQGHGTIALSNTELFEGGYISLGTRIYAKITPDMTLEVPEGKYELTVANDGYGDTKTIRVRSLEVTLVDLDEYKGEGPKLSNVTFSVNVEDALLYINGDEIDYEEPVELRYGVYRLTVIAEGYETWERQLVIHSEDAMIEIGESQLESDGSSTESEDADEQTEDDEGSQIIDDTEDTSSDTVSSTTTGSGITSDSTAESYSDYLDTITELLESLTADET